MLSLSFSLFVCYVHYTPSTNYNQLFLVPPTLRAVPQNGQVAARKGSTVTLECKASGNPVPSIYWFKKVICDKNIK